MAIHTQQRVDGLINLSQGIAKQSSAACSVAFARGVLLARIGIRERVDVRCCSMDVAKRKIYEEWLVGLQRRGEVDRSRCQPCIQEPQIGGLLNDD